MIRYLLNEDGFTPGGSGRLTCPKIGKKQLYTKGEKIQKHRIHKIENKTRKQT